MDVPFFESTASATLHAGQSYAMTHDHTHPPGAGCGHGHSHGLAPEHLDRAMATGVALNTLFVAGEAVAGVASGSLALLADAGHNAGDVLGLLLAWGAAWLARRPPSRRYTWGLRRSTIYAALANAVLLLVACGGIAWIGEFSVTSGMAPKRSSPW